MKKKGLMYITVCLLVSMLIGCESNADSEMTLSATAPVETTASPAFTPSEIPPTSTPTITLTPTVSITATPTLDVQAITLYTFDFYYTKSSLFEFDLHYYSGEYYGTGRLQDGGILQYTCLFREEGSSRVVCTGGDVPFNTTVFFQLFRQDNDELIYSNTFINDVLTHGETLYTPTGVSCVVEPVVNGLTHDEKTGVRCFIMTCRQNEQFLWGTVNTCTNPWPYQWDYYHPLHTPGT